MQINNTLPKTQGKKTKHNYHGFTLVELIVVITILVILGTIAFMSLSGYSGNARDSSRVSDLTNLSKGLDIAYIKTGSYPTPDNPFTVTYSGGTLWYQGIIGDTVMNIIGANGAKISKKPTDPLNATKEYTYSKLAYGNAYQIKADWEGDSVAYGNIPKASLIPQVQAASGNPILTYAKGTYNGVVAKTQTGSTIYVLAIPSLFLATGTGTMILSTTSSTGFYLHGQTNSGGVSFMPKIVYSSGSLPGSDAERILFASGVALAYSGTILTNNTNIQSFITALAANNTGALINLGGYMVASWLGGTIGVSSSTSSNITNATCGQNSTTYAAASWAFLGSTAADFCTIANSTLSGWINPTFPSAGSSVSWICTSNPTWGSSASCTAIHTAPVIAAYSSATTYTAGQQFNYNRATITVTAAGLGTASTTYLGCSSADVAIWTNGAAIPQIWSLCNVGANTVFAGYVAGAADSPAATEATAGKYFQWWENAAWDYNGGVLSTDNCLWNRDTQACGASALSAWQNFTFSDTTGGWVDRWFDWSATDNRGPCAANYHVPSQTEWDTVNAALGGAPRSVLKAPITGQRTPDLGGLFDQNVNGYYWSSTPNSGANFASNPKISPLFVSTATSNRAYGYSVRCIKN